MWTTPQVTRCPHSSGGERGLGQEPRNLSPHLSPRHFFGAELRHWRELHDLSQDQLGRLVHASGDTIGKIEKAQRWPPDGLAEAWDAFLVTGGALARLWPMVDVQHHNSRGHAVSSNAD